MLNDPEILLRLLAAAVLGGAVGLERERLEWVAGLRTHMLVCLGAALVMVVSAHGFNDMLKDPHVVLDPSRVAAQVVSGIGFLGAGTILFLRQEVIRGLTTAASLWTVAAVGLAVGGGLYLAAVVTTLLVLAILALVKPLERRLFRRDLTRQVTVLIDRRQVSLQQVSQAIEASGVAVSQIVLTPGDNPNDGAIAFTLLRGAPRDTVGAIATELQAMAGVRQVSL